jgi:hypothetical protein
LYEGKTQNEYKLAADKKFNVFNLLTDLKKVGADIISNQILKDNTVLINVMMQDSAKNDAEEIINKHAKIIG